MVFIEMKQDSYRDVSVIEDFKFEGLDQMRHILTEVQGEGTKDLVSRFTRRVCNPWASLESPTRSRPRR